MGYIAWYERVCAQETPQLGGVPRSAALWGRCAKSSPIVIVPQAGDLALAGEKLIRVHSARGEACFAVGIVSLVANGISTAVRHGRAEMVFENVIRAVAATHDVRAILTPSSVPASSGHRPEAYPAQNQAEIFRPHPASHGLSHTRPSVAPPAGVLRHKTCLHG